MFGDREISQDLVEEQRRIEEEAALMGVRRAARALEKAKEKEREATSQVGATMVNRVVLPMAALLQADFEKRAKGNASAGGPLLRPLRELAPELLSMVAARAGLNQMSKPIKLTAVCRRIGEALEDEYRWHRWEELSPAEAAAVRRRVDNTPNPHQRRNALAGFARRWREQIVSNAWEPGQLIGVGLKFVDYLVRLGVLQKFKMDVRTAVSARSRLKRAAWAVKLTSEAETWYRDMAEFIAVSRPLAWPLVIPPVRWTEPFGGGFHFRAELDHPGIPRTLRPLPLVRRASKEQRALLHSADLTHVYAGLNALQDTAWRINPRIYHVLSKLVEEGKEVPGLTAYEPKELPERLSDDAFKDKAKRIARNQSARRVYYENSRMTSKRMSQHRIFSAARRFVTYKEIYFAYNLDFRGRVYACSDDLSPQGNDLQRGLLEFANGEPLTDGGRDWLLIHLANCWGVDKVGFKARIRWAVDNLPMVRRIAEDPLEHREWFNADKKFVWQFLAACLTWAEYEANPSASCRVPVMLDGSCSGIQHYAALMKDAETAPKVNLVPQDSPGDLYTDVSERVMELLPLAPPLFPPRKVETSAYGAEEKEYAEVQSRTFAQEWAAWGINRKIVKRPVMVLPYGGSFLATLKYVREEVLDRMEAEGPPGWFPMGDGQPSKKVRGEATNALAQFTWRVMKEKVTKPMEGMAYVKRMVRAWAAHCPKKKFHWTSPCGLPVVTDYPQKKTLSAVTGQLDGASVTLSHFGTTSTTNWKAVEMGAPPNFVHSLDASHLLFSLAAAKRAGMNNLAAVHDAFGTSPTCTEEFAQLLREEFANLYKADPFEDLRTALVAQGASLPEAPKLGSLNTDLIREAAYLFA